MFNKKLTLEQAIDDAVNKLAGDINALQIKKQAALNVFIEATCKLKDVNAALVESVGKMDNLIATIGTLKGETQRSIDENEATIKKLVSIVEG